ncbi:MAG: choline ABC transporter permease subunit, partial [Dehalococcoidia bacterium]|nr:choline ABC transporter permease subunit [Dehalococcoidia bacterium]
MVDFPEIFSLPLAEWINIAVKWLTITLAPVFDVITVGIRTPLVYIERSLLWLPWWVLVLILTIISWKVAKHWVAMVTVVGLIFIGVIGLWNHTMTTLAIIVTSVFVSVLIGIPLGIA